MAGQVRVPITFDFDSNSKDNFQSNVFEQRESLLASFGLSIILVGILSSTLNFWDASGSEILPSFRYALLLGATLIGIAALKAQKFGRSLFLNMHGHALSVFVIFFSDWLNRAYNLMQGPSIRGEIILGTLISALVIKRNLRNFWAYYLFVSIAFLCMAFYQTAQGRLIFSDDHASFIYRLALLKENFPGIPFYNPLWNAGFDARDFFATGALGIYLLFLPLVEFFELTSVYNAIVTVSLFLLLPCSITLCAHYYGASRLAKCISAILSLGTSLLWYRWALKYGTLGFSISTALIPLNIVLASKFISPNQVFKKFDYLIFFLSLSFCLLWPGAALAFVPFYILGLFSFRLVLKDRTKTIWLLSFFLIHILWMIPFATVSKVSKFIVSESSVLPDREIQSISLSNEQRVDSPKLFKMKAKGIDPERALKHLREHAISANPLLLVLGLPGLMLISDRFLRRTLAYSAGWFLLGGGILYSLKPQLEMDRMLLQLLLILCVPAGLAIEQIWCKAKESAIKMIPAALCGGFLFATPLAVISIVSNRSIEQYYFASPLVDNLVDGISTHSGPGRVLFSGFVLQDISGGHAAPLADFTDKPLITSAFFHTQWWYTDVIPEDFRSRGDAGIQEFLDLYNVSAVVAHEPFWRKYFSDRPHDFHKVWHYDRFYIFERLNYSSNYFLEGTGSVIQQSSNKVKFTLNGTSGILKFTFFPFLKVEGCQIAPYSPAPGINFVKLDNCPTGKELALESVSIVERVAGS